MSLYPSSNKKLKSKVLVGECMYYLLLNSYATPEQCLVSGLFSSFGELLFHRDYLPFCARCAAVPWRFSWTSPPLSSIGIDKLNVE